jgi:hypothetical protein
VSRMKLDKVRRQRVEMALMDPRPTERGGCLMQCPLMEGLCAVSRRRECVNQEKEGEARQGRAGQGKTTQGKAREGERVNKDQGQRCQLSMKAVSNRKINSNSAALYTPQRNKRPITAAQIFPSSAAAQSVSRPSTKTHDSQSSPRHPPSQHTTPFHVGRPLVQPRTPASLFQHARTCNPLQCP